jgi:hypothetical protein
MKIDYRENFAHILADNGRRAALPVSRRSGFSLGGS